LSEDTREYNVRVVWTGEKSGDVIVDDKPVIRTGRSPESAGIEFHSPEELFVASASVCFMNSFVVFTQKMHISFKSFEVEAKGTLERVDKSYEITKMHMKTIVTVDSEELRSKMERALELGAKYCYVSNSMKCPTEHENVIVVG
jgi:organic hydroperoxide reductase OsmC/OhrA